MHAMFLICRLTSHGHIRKMPFDLKGELVTLHHHYAKFIGNRLCGREERTSLTTLPHDERDMYRSLAANNGLERGGQFQIGTFFESNVSSSF